MSASHTSPTRSSLPARHGDLAVVVSTQRSAFISGGTRERQSVVLGRVSGITRDGVVTRYKAAQFSDAPAREEKVTPRERVLIVKAGVVDVRAVLDEYRQRVYDGSSTSSSGGGMVYPYESLDEARSSIRKWRYRQ